MSKDVKVNEEVRMKVKMGRKQDVGGHWGCCFDLEGHAYCPWLIHRHLFCNEGCTWEAVE